MPRLSFALVFGLIAVLAMTFAAPHTAFAAGEGDAVFIYATRGDEQVHFVSAADLSPHDGGEKTLAAKLDIELGAHELAVSPDGKWAIGTAYGGPGQGHQPPDTRIAVIDMRTRTLHRVVKLTLDGWEFQRPNDIAFLPELAGDHHG